MSNVIDLNSHRKDPHLAGPAKCVGCGYEWTAVAPAGTYEIECPECICLTGIWDGLTRLNEEVWTCNCGNHYFLVAKTHICCVRCGLSQTFPR